MSGDEIAASVLPVRTMPPSIANLLELSTPSPRNSPVQAYAKLEFGAYSFYVQSLSVTLGRKAADNDHVDVHLGNTKAISRQHARVQYSFSRNAFEIFVGGRNGLFVDDIFYEQGSVVPLDDRTQVQIGEIKFNFLLPHQGALPQDPLPGEEKESSEELTTPSITSPTPPPETEKTLLKPDIPYPTLIAQSLLSHPRRRRTLPDIYKWIADHHPYFNQRAGNRSWQSSIRQNLVNNQAFVLYDDGGQVTGKTKRSKRAKEEWGISPEYEGLIGNLTATEDDTEKLSTKLAKKAAQPKTPKPPKQPKPPPKPKDKEKPKQQSPAVSPPPPQAQTEEASRVEEITRRMQGKGVDMSALLAEAFAKMKAVPLKPPQPSPQPPQLPAAKRPKPNPPPKAASPSTCPPSRVINQPTTATKNSNNQPQLPITMPMPLPYTTKAAPIPTIGSTPVVQVKKESTPVVVPVPVASPSLPTPSPAPPPATNATTESDLSSMSPQTIDLPDPSIKPAITSDIPPPNGIKAAVAATPIPAKPVETAASRRQPRGKKRALES